MIPKSNNDNIKKIILESSGKISFEIEHILNIIPENDLLLIFYACFIESPIFLIGEDPSQEKLKILFHFLNDIFPFFYDDCVIFDKKSYNQYNSNNFNIKNYTAISLKTNEILHKPFEEAKLKPFYAVLTILMNGPFENQKILAREFIVNLYNFVDSIDLLQKKDTKRILKFFKNSYSEHFNIFKSELMDVMRSEKTFRLYWRKAKTRKRRLHRFYKFWQIAFEDHGTRETIYRIRYEFECEIFVFNKQIPYYEVEYYKLNHIQQKLLDVFKKKKILNIDEIINTIQSICKKENINIELYNLPTTLDYFLENNLITSYWRYF